VLSVLGLEPHRLPFSVELILVLLDDQEVPSSILVPIML
jgi:hypothetical protein